MSEERLWKFRKPEWLNSVYARNAGVYSAGALVSSPDITTNEEMGSSRGTWIIWVMTQRHQQCRPVPALCPRSFLPLRREIS